MFELQNQRDTCGVKIKAVFCHESCMTTVALNMYDVGEFESGEDSIAAAVLLFSSNQSNPRVLSHST